jgi:hypothetical protein
MGALFAGLKRPQQQARPWAGGEYMSHITQIKELRERARKQITEGAVTDDYKLDR